MKASNIDSIVRIICRPHVISRIVTKIRIKRIHSYFASPQDIALGESDFNNRKLIVGKYLSRNWRGLKKTEIRAEFVIANAPVYKDRNDKEAILYDMLFCRLAYGFEPDEYLCFGLEGKDTTYIKKWISDLDRYTYIFSINNLYDSQVFNNKYLTYEAFRKFYKRRVVHVKTKADYAEFEKFYLTHSEIVKKPVFEGMGHGIELINTAKIAAHECFIRLLKDGEHIVEERIYQDESLSAFNESSVNTIRCITVNTKGGVRIPYTFLKTGRKGSFVDNGGAGGILAGIDAVTGIICTHGYDEFNSEYASHPDSGIAFKGYAFPKWGEMIELCIEMANKIPTVKCIGWDVTLTNDGWIVVEGNGQTQFVGPQIVFKRGIRSEMEQLMSNMDKEI